MLIVYVLARSKFVKIASQKTRFRKGLFFLVPPVFSQLKCEEITLGTQKNQNQTIMLKSHMYARFPCTQWGTGSRVKIVDIGPLGWVHMTDFDSELQADPYGKFPSV